MLLETSLDGRADRSDGKEIRMGQPLPGPLRIIIDSASLITAAKFSVDGRTVIEHIADRCQAIIVPAVHSEVILAGAVHADAAHIQAMVVDGRITVEAPTSPTATVLDRYKLGRGEKESIILALSRPHMDYLVVDDRLAFIVSDRMTVPKILLADLLVQLVWKGLLDRELSEKMLKAIEPRYAPGFIPHTLKMLEGGDRKCLT
jgi:predicted nucleic acid-binding protein